jgi:plastocyanin
MRNREFTNIARLVVIATAGVACGGGSDAPTQPPVQTAVFTSLSVNPTSGTLFTVAPGNTLSLSATPRDQNGQVMSGLGAPTFTSADAAVSVSSAGEVTALQEGGAQITASLTSAGITRTAVASITVQEAPAAAAVTAPAVTFNPNLVHISSGGTVTWTFGPVPHNVTFSGSGAPENVATMSDASVSRTFSTSGTFSYQCTVHAGMSGSVVVH